MQSAAVFFLNSVDTQPLYARRGAKVNSSNLSTPDSDARYPAIRLAKGGGLLFP
jgi:hypothetical protein